MAAGSIRSPRYAATAPDNVKPSRDLWTKRDAEKSRRPKNSPSREVGSPAYGANIANHNEPALPAPQIQPAAPDAPGAHASLLRRPQFVSPRCCASSRVDLGDNPESGRALKPQTGATCIQPRSGTLRQIAKSAPASGAAAGFVRRTSQAATDDLPGKLPSQCRQMISSSSII